MARPSEKLSAFGDTVIRLLYLLRLFASGCWQICLLPFLAGVLFCAILGVLAIVDALNPARLPSIQPTKVTPLFFRCDLRPSREELLAMPDEAKWDSMGNALFILEQVSPPIAEWTRGKWESGQLVFDTHQGNTLGWYMPATGFVGITISGLSQSDAELACTLAHEFRHSRQPILPIAQTTIAAVFGIDRKFELTEAEAYEFDDRVRQAIRGKR